MPRFDRLELGPDPDQSRRSSAAAAVEVSESRSLRQADLERRQGLYENSLRHYSRALEFDKALVPGWLGQVQMLILLGEYPEAELWARKALEIFRDNPDLMAARAQALSRMGDAGKALPLCDAALAQPGVGAYRWTVRGELMISGKQGVDRHCFDKAVQLDPDWLVPLEIALVYLYHRKPGQAVARARQAVEKSPDAFYAWYICGSAEQEAGLSRPARASLKRCLELCPGHVEAKERLTKGAAGVSFLTRGLRRLLGNS